MGPSDRQDLEAQEDCDRHLIPIPHGVDIGFRPGLREDTVGAVDIITLCNLIGGLEQAH